MCYNAGIERLKPLALLQAEQSPAIPARDEVNAMARPLVPVRSMEGNWQAMHWLLVPPWVTDSDRIRTLKIWLANARIEELEKKKLFRPLITDRRCIVRFSWFFEWRHENGRKIKFRVGLPDDEPLLLPGLWQRGEVDGRVYDSCTVCTMEARGVMRYVHNSTLRQPVVVGEPGAAAWLDRDTTLDKARDAVIADERSSMFETDPETDGT